MSCLSSCFAMALCTLGLLGTSARGAEMQWIWGSPEAAREAPVGACQFQKSFNAGELQSATIEIACDNRYVLRLNDRLVGASNRWEQLDRFDVTQLVANGENKLTVRAINDEGAAGLAARIILQPKQGQPQTIVTDASWQARLQGPGGWNPEALKQHPFQPAHVLGPFGKQAPWENRVAVADTIRTIGKAADGAASGPLELKDGDRVVLLGNTLIERAQQYGYLETALTVANPGKQLVFRNLGWSGDTVFGHARARFGSVKDGFAHLAEHVHGEKPSVIFVGYGSNAAFAGEDGLAAFVAGLDTLLDTLESTGARIVLLSPLKQEDHGRPLPDPTAHNRDLRLYADAIADAAQRRGHRFVDLYKLLGAESSAHPLPEEQRLTDRGVHLTGRGYWKAAEALSTDLGIEPVTATVTATYSPRQGKAQGAKLHKLVATKGRVEITLQRAQLPRPPQPNGEGRATSAHIRTIAAGSAGPEELTISISGLEPGEYRAKVDDTPIGTVRVKEAQQPAHFAISGGPDQAQAERLRKQINKKNRLYFHRWRPQNETYLYLFRKHEQGNNAREIPQFDPLVAQREAEIRLLSVPLKHTYTLEWIKK